MEIVKIILPNWFGSKTFMNAEKTTNIDHRGKQRIQYKVIDRHTYSYGNEEIITETGKNTIYYPCDIIELTTTDESL